MIHIPQVDIWFKRRWFGCSKSLIPALKRASPLYSAPLSNIVHKRSVGSLHGFWPRIGTMNQAHGNAVVSAAGFGGISPPVWKTGTGTVPEPAGGTPALRGSWRVFCSIRTCSPPINLLRGGRATMPLLTELNSRGLLDYKIPRLRRCLDFARRTAVIPRVPPGRSRQVGRHVRSCLFILRSRAVAACRRVDKLGNSETST